uniref:Uncharacterized protein n=1 Tax=Myotis myotis TaxID=51298 RepID=A0A7J7RMP4_MYOMY|nr:hypothetical protein mMyoMyo1_010263 [Myotis myotis]
MHGPSPRPRQYNPSLTKLSLLLGNRAGLLGPAFSLHSNHAALAAAHYSSRMAQNLWTLALFLGLKSKVGFFYGRTDGGETLGSQGQSCDFASGATLHLARHNPPYWVSRMLPLRVCERTPFHRQEIEGVFCSSYNII